MRHLFKRNLALLVVWFLGLAITPELTAADKPNFIVIIGDDISKDDYGCYGHPHIKTPNVDLLAKEGMRFDSAFLTCSSCSPSRCSIMTGRYPHNTGAQNLHMPLPEDQTVFAEFLKQNGYYTGAAGKWHLGNSPKKSFDKIVGGKASGAEFWVPMLQERPKDKPFFFWFASFDAHRGWSKNAIKEPHTKAQIVVPPFLPDNDPTREDLGLYYDEVSRMDEYVGKVRAELKSQGVDKNTMIIFLADNGRPFPRCKTTIYDSGVHTPFVVYYPPAIGKNAGTPSNSLVSSIDIAPTIIEAAGLEQSKRFQGKSFLPILKDPKAETHKHVFSEHNWHDFQAHERSVRNDRYLYIRNSFPELAGTPPADAVRSITYQTMIKMYKSNELPPQMLDCFTTPRPAEMLFDVQKDPHQMVNIATDPESAEALKQMRSELDQWIKDTNDRVPEDPKKDTFDRETGKGIKKKK